MRNYNFLFMCYIYGLSPPLECQLGEGKEESLVPGPQLELHKCQMNEPQPFHLEVPGSSAPFSHPPEHCSWNSTAQVDIFQYPGR